jgi:hypothetical protein
MKLASMCMFVQNVSMMRGEASSGVAVDTLHAVKPSVANASVKATARFIGVTIPCRGSKP